MFLCVSRHTRSLAQSNSTHLQPPFSTSFLLHSGCLGLFVNALSQLGPLGAYLLISPRVMDAIGRFRGPRALVHEGDDSDQCDREGDHEGDRDYPEDEGDREGDRERDRDYPEDEDAQCDSQCDRGRR